MMRTRTHGWSFFLWVPGNFYLVYNKMSLLDASITHPFRITDVRVAGHIDNNIIGQVINQPL